MHRQMGQRTLVEGWLPERLGRNRRLDGVNEVVDWSRFERLLGDIHSARTGRPSYPPLLMCKVLLLQQWYDLSDVEMEEALADRLSFRRFVGLGLEDPTPDHSTLSRFRETLVERGLGQALLAEFERQLDERGLLLKQGTLLDASVVEAQVRRPPRSAGRGARHASDPEAGWTGVGRGRRSLFGYKIHCGVDLGSGFIRRARLTSANIYESLVADELICGDEQAVYADKAYESKARRARLRSRGVKDRIKHRAHRYQPKLPHWQEQRNQLIEPRRRAVERLFGTFKRSYGYRRVRYRGVARNELELCFKALAFNLRKADQLHGAPA